MASARLRHGHMLSIERELAGALASIRRKRAHPPLVRNALLRGRAPADVALIAVHDARQSQSDQHSAAPGTLHLRALHGGGVSACDRTT
ncbi:MAG: hypothetical protein EXR63_02670 [Dehalococcoidia bacterium]|nr:hypothetical protein [Dehalococcoidia bacterium]